MGKAENPVTYRPITDFMLLAHPKVAYHGAFPAGFLQRARDLLGVAPDAAVLHVCGGRVKDYPYEGFGHNDRTLDLDVTLHPDFCQDAREAYPLDGHSLWAAVLIDRPYTEEDADRYAPGRAVWPGPDGLLARAFDVVPVGHKVGVLDYYWPHPGKPQVRRKAHIVCADLFDYLKGLERTFDHGFYDIWQSDGEHTFHTVVVPLRKLSRDRVGNVVCWNEDIMRGQLLLGIHSRAMAMGLKMGPPFPTLEVLTTPTDSIYVDWAVPFWKAVARLGDEPTRIMELGRRYVSAYGILTPRALQEVLRLEQ